MVVPLLTPTPVMAPVLETVAEAAAMTVLAPVVLILALILGSTTPAGGPGIPQPQLVPVSRDELRLRELVAKQAGGTLTSEEEAELIALLAKVKGIHVEKLTALKTVSADFAGKVPMEESDLGRMALKHRIENGIWHNGNITVFEYEDNLGKLQHLVQSTLPTTKKHAEHLYLSGIELRIENIKFTG